MTDFWREIQEGARYLGRRPGFSVVAVLTLGMGIGANTAIFSLVNAVLLQPLPYRQPEQLVRLFETNLAKGGSREMTSISNLEDWRKQALLFTGLAAWQRPATITLTSDTPAVELRANFVSANYFDVLGVNAAQGRTFGPEEDAETPTRAVLISDGFWRRQLGGRPGVVGSTVQIEDKDFNVIGVLPSNLVSPAGDADVWLPIRIRPGDNDRGQTYLQVLARLKPGVTPGAAQAELDGVASRLAAAFPNSNRGRGIAAAPLTEEIVGGVRRPLLLVLGAVGLLLLIACANAANLFLLRNTERRAEMAIRAALGASRVRVMRQLLVEAGLVSLLGGALGVVLASGIVGLVKSLGLNQLPRIGEVQVDATALAFTAMLSILTALLCGIVPGHDAAWGGVPQALREGGARNINGGKRQGRARGILVVSQVALTLILLTGAGLLTRSLLRLMSVDPGFHPDGVLVARISLGGQYEGDERKAAYIREVTEKLRHIPGVTAAGAVTVLPMNPFGIDFDVPYHRLDEPEPVRSAAAKARFRAATPGYFEAIGMPLALGRGFMETDRQNSPRVVVVNQALAERVWPGRSALGQTIRFFWADWQSYEVVGVVGNAKSYGLAASWRPELFVPNEQIPYGVMNIVVRTTNARTAAGPVREAIVAFDVHQPLSSLAFMSDLIAESLARERFTFVWLAAFAGLALVLATLGIYTVASFAASQRRREIGVRMALGATPRDVLMLTLASGARLSLIGIVAGMVGSLAVTRAIESVLFEVHSNDPVTLVGVSALLMITSVAAAWMPAWRAARTDPNGVLREG